MPPGPEAEARAEAFFDRTARSPPGAQAARTGRAGRLLVRAGAGQGPPRRGGGLPAGPEGPPGAAWSPTSTRLCRAARPVGPPHPADRGRPGHGPSGTWTTRSATGSSWSRSDAARGPRSMAPAVRPVMPGRRGHESVGGSPCRNWTSTTSPSPTTCSAPGEPVVLVCGCGQPAVAWQLTWCRPWSPPGYQVVTFDNRGVAPSSSPPAALLGGPTWSHDALGSARPPGSRCGQRRRALDGRMGGRDDGHPASGPGARGGDHGQLQRGHRLGEGHHHRGTRPGPARTFAAPAVLRHRDPALSAQLTNSRTTRVVDAWLEMIGDLTPWPNPGRLGPVRGLPGLVPRSRTNPGRGRPSRCHVW